ncbi:Retrovirus-related Pol polyprotein from transposon RE1 [Vitis vinifera]|uniref:Retrovirus-related Pol polyprotein from transposon RE1 n=1 Tax=Vitis vinifera TaxID=29760 RepID=A0A438J6G8_VITVI|nr:Retrovirus-related Pol polyprotein from transposon RE1 [Vitis vinifera]
MRLLLQPRLPPTSIPTYLVLPSEPCTYLFWGFLSPSALQTAFPAKFRLLSLHPIPARALGRVLLPFLCENYLSWSASVELWFMGQGYEDHLVTQEADIPELDKFFMVLTLIGLRPDLEPIRDQILGSSSVPSLDDVFCSPPPLHGRPPRTAHMAQSSDSPLPQPPSSSASQTSQASIASVAQPGNASACLTHTSSLGPWILDSGASDHLSAKITRTLNCSITFSDKFVTLQDRSTGKTIGIGRESQGLYHLTSDSSPAVCISTDAPLLIHNRLGHPSLSKFQKMVPRFSTLSSLPCESCQLGKHTRVSFQSLNARIDILLRQLVLSSSIVTFLFVFGGDAVLTACYLINRMPSSILHDQIPHSLLFPDQPLYFLPPRVFGYFRRVIVVIPLRLIDTLSPLMSPSLRTHHSFPPLLSLFLFLKSCSFPLSPHLMAMPPRPLQVYHRRPRVVAPLPFPEAPADSLPIPSASPAPALPSPNDLPIAVQKSTRSTRNPHPIYNFLSYHRLSSPYSAFVSAISSVSLPKSTHEALSHPSWRQTMVDEMAALHSNGTWDLVVLPSGKSTVGCRWVYAVKVGPDGQVDRLKARLVAKGYTQVYGSDYGDTFSPVAKIASVRLLLSMAAMCSWPLYQLDIKNAFLHGDLAEEVYMEQPPGFVAQGESGLVCRLRRSLYGLKQSPRAWFSHFSSVVQEFGMLRSTADHSVFYHHNSLGQCIYLVVYVDDIVITGSDQDGIQKLKQHLFTHFQTKDLGKLKYFLGIEIAQSSSGVVLSQRKYALDILEETGMLDCKPVDTPMDPNVKLVPGTGGAFRRPREISTARRPRCIVREQRSYSSVGYTDADWAGSPQIDVPLQGTVFLLEELRFGKDEQMKLICDNQAALHIASNPVFHERTKHIEVDCHFIREKIASGCVATSFVNSNDQLADIFTKSLRGPRIKYICNKLGAYDVYAPA